MSFIMMIVFRYLYIKAIVPPTCCAVLCPLDLASPDIHWHCLNVSCAPQVRLQWLWDRFDANRDGQLDGREQARLLLFVAPGLGERRLARWLDAMRRDVDVDHDGNITYMVRWCEAVCG